MDYELLNDGEPNEEGYYEANIKNMEGQVVSSYKTKSLKEMTEKLLQSQVHANREIARLRKPDYAKRQPLKVEPKELTAADRLRLSSEITDPDRVVEAVDEIVTARMGIAPDKVGADFARKNEQEQTAYFRAEAEAFRRERPDYYPVDQNMRDLHQVLIDNKWDYTRNNLILAYDQLVSQGKLIPWPEAEDTEPEANPPQTPTGATNGNGHSNGQSARTAYSPRPRTIATTGLRGSDASALPPPPQSRKQKYTRADIESMSRAEYNDKLRSDPEFRRQVDAMGSA